MSLRSQMRYMNPYQIHKALINEYILNKPGDTKYLQRDTSKDKRDIDVIKDHHKFLWDESDKAETWEEQFARKYYDKLFKEYTIGDLTRYKENKVGLRWRTEQEVVLGKGQFICGNKHCQGNEDLRTWEVNFAYIEGGMKKNALVKIRLCPECSRKLNYKNKKKEVKRVKKKRHAEHKEDVTKSEKIGESKAGSSKENKEELTSQSDQSLWENLKPKETKTRDEEMEEYLEDLLL